MTSSEKKKLNEVKAGDIVYMRFEHAYGLVVCDHDDGDLCIWRFDEKKGGGCHQAWLCGRAEAIKVNSNDGIKKVEENSQQTPPILRRWQGMQDATTRFDVGDTVVINGATWQPEEPRRVEREAEGVDGAVVTQGVVTQPEMPTNDWRWTPGTEITPAMTAALQAAQEAVREEDPPNLRELAGIYEHTMGQPVPPPPQLNPNDDLERAIEDRYEEIAQDDEWEDDLEDDNEDDDY